MGSDDEDRDAILRRRNRFVAIALSGLTSTIGPACGDDATADAVHQVGEELTQQTSPQACLEQTVVMTPIEEDASAMAQDEEDAGTDAGVDASAPAPRAQPRPCLRRVGPRPCLRMPAPTACLNIVRPQPCLDYPAPTPCLEAPAPPPDMQAPEPPPPHPCLLVLPHKSDDDSDDA